MDNIGPAGKTSKISDFIKNVTHIGGGADKAKEAKEPHDEVKIGKLKFSSSDIGREGKLDIIVSSGDRKKLDDIRQMIAKSGSGKVTSDLKIIKGLSAEVKADSEVLKKIADMGDDVEVTVDAAVKSPDPPNMKWPGFIRRLLGAPNVYQKSLNLEKAWESGITGKGVTIAVIDTGIHPHPDIANRIIGFKDFVNGETQPYDDQGHGTHCSGIAAGSGEGSKGKYIGAAPEASLVGIKVLNSSGYGSSSNVIKAIQWAMENMDKYGIRVLSLSLGESISKPAASDPVVQAVDAATKAGLVVVVAAGNSGPFGGTVGSPGNAPGALTVGAMDDKGTAKKGDDSLAWFSSRGPTKYDNLAKPDVIASGVNIMSAKNEDEGYTMMSGTSMATPLTAGVAALLIQKNPDARPGQVKEALMETADKIRDYDKFKQGAGVIDPLEAMDKIRNRMA
ncbi:MAG: S8 family peptidase [Chloroflexi bacterium]|nr:S8 family peptidase [Chloroflexota bacterium]